MPLPNVGSRMSRTITLVILSGVMLSTCCCLLAPSKDEQKYDENGNPIPPEQTASSTGTATTHRRSWFGSPWFWSSGSRSWGGSNYGRSSFGGSSFGGTSSGGSRPASSGSSVKTGGFGSTAAKMGGGSTS